MMICCDRRVKRWENLNKGVHEKQLLLAVLQLKLKRTQLHLECPPVPRIPLDLLESFESFDP